MRAESTVRIEHDHHPEDVAERFVSAIRSLGLVVEAISPEGEPAIEFRITRNDLIPGWPRQPIVIHGADAGTLTIRHGVSDT